MKRSKRLAGIPGSVERFGPDRLLDLTEEEINTRLDAFRNLSAIPTIVPLVGITS